jgi:hypothetical protein
MIALADKFTDKSGRINRSNFELLYFQVDVAFRLVFATEHKPISVDDFVPL